MPQARHRRTLLKLSLFWLAGVLLLAITAAVQRQRELSSVQRECSAGLRPYAEQGQGEDWDYIHPWQGYSIYLIENRRRSPELLRLLLLSEARRVDPGSYMNSYSLNHDLRRELMQAVLPRDNDDPMVHWATGVCHMNACEFSEAQHELQKALELGLSFDNTGIGKRDVLLRIMLAAAMDGDPTEALHWVRDTQLGEDPELQAMYADMLCRLYMYDECIAYCEPVLSGMSTGAIVDSTINFYRSESVAGPYIRALWWSGRFEDLRRMSREYDAYVHEQISRQVPIDWSQAVGGTFLVVPDLRFQMLNAELDRFRDTERSGGPPGEGMAILQLLCEGYALLGMTECREILAARFAGGKQRLADGAYGMPNQLSWEERDQLEQLTANAYGQLVRAELLRHDWAAAQKLLDDNVDNYYWPEPLPLPTARFLLGIVNGDDTEALTEELRGCIRIAPFLFHSPEYAAACAEGGRDPRELQQQLVRELARAPQPGEDGNWYSGASLYSDWSNGSLDW